MKWSQTFYKSTNLYLLLCICLFLLIFKFLVKNDVCIIYQNHKYYEITLLQTKISNLSKIGSYIEFNNTYLKSNLTLGHYFLIFKINILKMFNDYNLSNQLSMTLLFNEKLLPKNHLNLFKKIGIYHLIVISGMHIVILMEILHKLTNSFSKKNQNNIIILFCCMYLLIIKITFPVLYQILKLAIKTSKINKNSQILIISLLMLIVNFDNFNYLSYVLTIGIQIIIMNFKNFNISVINISLFTNLILYKYNNFFNLYSLLFTPFLILIFEKIIFKIVILNFMCLNLFSNIVIIFYKFFYNICIYCNNNLNILITNKYIIIISFILVLILNYIYLRYYENF